MTALFIYLQLHGAEIMQALTSVIAGASVLANFTRTDKDDKAIGFASKAVNFLAANFFTLKVTKATYNK